MSKEIVAEILRKVQALPRSENTKFRVYKTRLMSAKKNPLEENDAIVAAASKVGIDVGALLTPRLESVSKTVSTVEGVITEAVNSDYVAEDESMQLAINTDANIPITVLAVRSENSVFDSNEYGKLITFPSQDAAVLAGTRVSEPILSAALTPMQHNTAIYSSPSPAMTVSLKEPSIRWSIGVSSDIKTSKAQGISIESKAMVQTILAATAIAICTSALVYYGAIAGGGTVEAWFWAGFCEISGFALVVVPVAHFGRKIVVCSIGISMLVLGFFTMHTSIAGDTQQKISYAVQGDSEVSILEARVERLRADLTLKMENIKSFDPEKFRSKRERMTSETASVAKDLSEAENQLIESRKALINGDSANIASSWGLVEWLRRASLILVNLIAGHALVGSIGIVMANRLHSKR